MTTMTIEEAALDLKRVIHDSVPGEEIVLTEDGSQVAKLVAVREVSRPIVFGTAKGILLHIADDFDAPLEEFREYV